MIAIGEVGKTCPRCGKFFLGNECPNCGWKVLEEISKPVTRGEQMKKVKGVFR